MGTPRHVNRNLGGPEHGGDARSRTARTGECFDGRCPDAARWAARTGDECSAILAFPQLALERLDEDTPLEFVARAVRSAEQELSHTWAAAALASRYGRAPITRRSPAPRFRPRLPRRQQLARLAYEGWVDGCLNEGLAALVAAEEACDATDPEEARISAQIARDEAEHAALAFDVVRWVLDQDSTLAPNSAEQAEAARSQARRWARAACASSQTTTAGALESCFKARGYGPTARSFSHSENIDS